MVMLDSIPMEQWIGKHVHVMSRQRGSEHVVRFDGTVVRPAGSTRRIGRGPVLVRTDIKTDLWVKSEALSLETSSDRISVTEFCKGIKNGN